jgi:hypothetical protein
VTANLPLQAKSSSYPSAFEKEVIGKIGTTANSIIGCNFVLNLLLA